MYADDTTLYFDLNPGTPNFVNIINGELGKVSKWLSANRLSLNVNKTTVMFFHSVRKAVPYPKLYIDNKEREGVDFLFIFGTPNQSQSQLEQSHSFNFF